uniref:Uncharacterized protein n=1 Tax=Anguilla anguilla TaxID=7936 RepID=A0A0E9RSH5_ANGAN
MKRPQSCLSLTKSSHLHITIAQSTRPQWFPSSTLLFGLSTNNQLNQL